MKYIASLFLIIFAILVCFTNGAVVASVGEGSQLNTRDLFSQFKARFNKQYSAEEEERRFRNFEYNINVVAARENKRNPNAEFGVNAFSDMSVEEFKVYHNLDQHRSKNHIKSRYNQLPPTTRHTIDKRHNKVDWREHGAVTHVKNQGQCGSCWAFSVVANIEGQWKLSGHNLTSLSEQELVSCDKKDAGCDGGNPPDTYQWLLEKEREKEHDRGTLVTEKSYEYKSGDGKNYECKHKKENDHRDIGAKIYGYEQLPHNENVMADWCSEHGPISICVDATSFQTYTKGIMTKCVSQQMDHCVAIVGYNEEHHIPYWIVKNSWGESWGEKGYIYIEMHKDQCLIAQEPTSSKVKKE